MKRRSFLLRCGKALSAVTMAGPIEALTSLPRRRMNLLLLTVDDMNWSMPGFMGNKHISTPSMDELAAKSHRFVNNRTTAAICQPSREAMMTGRVPHRSGGLGFTPVHEGTPTLVTILKEHGYFTTGIHKLEHMEPASCFPWDLRIEGKGRAPSEYAAAVQEGIGKARNAEKPFFINCNINDPHRPFYGSPQAAGVDHDEQGEYQVVREVAPEEVEVPAWLEDLPAIRKELAQYANSVQRSDMSVGKVLETLTASSEAENTIILFSSDHGMGFPFAKATVYDAGTRTPALLCYPGMRSPQIFEERTCNIDYLPTLLGLLHVPVPPGIDGISWAPILRGASQRNREYLVTNINSVSSGAEYPMRAIQDGRYSLVFMPWSDDTTKVQNSGMSGLSYKAMVAAAKDDPQLETRVKQWDFGIPLALYDLEEDPGQRINLIDLAEHRERVKKMKMLLLEEMQRTEDPQLSNFRTLLRGGKPVVYQPEMRKSTTD